MGRKPNPLINEFFIRGPKLEDQSNRYSHTCKQCGQVFPKGRPDSLNRHLFDKCPNITEDDRQRAITRAQESANFQAQGQQGHGFSQFTQVIDSGGSDLASLHREPSALDTLAEASRLADASRHHLDLSQHNTQQYGGLMGYQSSQDMHHDTDGLFAQLQQQLTEQGGDGGEHGFQDSDTHNPPQVSAEARVSPLVQTASAATQLDAPNQDYTSSTSAHTGGVPIDQIQTPTNERPVSADVNLDPQLQDQHNPHEATSMVPDHDHGNDHDHDHDRDMQFLASAMQSDNNGQTDAPYHPQSDMTHHSFSSPFRGYGLIQKGKRQQRSRFTEERRKEVGGIRKLGACLRCRMLKKPCSGDTPCTTCRTIESARLWKNACVRLRLADEFSLYNKKLFYSKAHHKVNLAMSGRLLQRPNGRIEATLFPEDKVYVSFKPMSAVYQDGMSGQMEEGAKDADLDNTLFMIDFEADDMTTKLEHYLVDETDKFIDHEPLHFLKSTLKTATKLISEQGDILLAKAINLWTATNVLATSAEARWNIHLNTEKKAAYEPETTEPGPHTISSDRTDYDLMRSQLLDATERYCATQGKAVVAELERRLLARQQTAAFITFLVSVILLNCIERMSLLYKSFDISPAQDADTKNNESESLAYIPIDWPLDAPPAAFWPQGASFANLLHLLLRLRGLPPRTYVRDDDSVAVITDSKASPIEVPTDGSHLDHVDVQQVYMAQWLQGTGAVAHDLRAARDLSNDVEAKPGAWDLRFIAGLLLADEG
ncbi:hypothetical protein MBLNU457_5339t1 [Dothideomycetes sp. NU457]